MLVSNKIFDCFRFISFCSRVQNEFSTEPLKAQFKLDVRGNIKLFI